MDEKVVDGPSLRFKRYVFKDRVHAGELLAEKLRDYSEEDSLVLAIPSGGVPVALVVAERLGLPLDLLVVRKIQIPWNPEAGFGAVTWDGIVVLNQPLLDQLNLTREEVEACIQQAKEGIARRLRKFRGDRPVPRLDGKTVMLVDDGLASGYTMLAAVKSVRNSNPGRIIVAVPTGNPGAIGLISGHADLVVCLNIRGGFFFAVADAYQRWYDLEDDEVLMFLRKAGILRD